MKRIKLEGHRVLRVVSISGGKDSTATALRCLEEYAPSEVRLVFADTGNEHEETLDYIRDYLPKALGMPILWVSAASEIAARLQYRRDNIREHWGKQGISAGIIERAWKLLKPTGNPFLDLCMERGTFPSRLKQFCTDELKVVPITDYQLSLTDEGYLVESWQGVRRDESTNRADATAYETLQPGVMWIHRPIVEWNALKVVQYVKARGVDLNPLYSQGCGRVGCMPCINANKYELRNIAQRWPEHIERIKEWESIVAAVSRRQQATFFFTTDEEGKKWGYGVEQHIKFARSVNGRGVSSIGFFNDAQAPACSSRYGLCE